MQGHWHYLERLAALTDKFNLMLDVASRASDSDLRLPEVPFLATHNLRAIENTNRAIDRFIREVTSTLANDRAY